MLSAALVSNVVASSWFAVSWAPYLLVDTDLNIRAANQAYAAATGHPRDALLERPLFEVFPDNPKNPQADGVVNLSGSFERVLTTAARHWMGFQRYDVPDLRKPGAFVPKIWTPVNSPVIESGRVVALLHHVQDVTRALERQDAQLIADRSRPGLEAAADSLWREFPYVQFEVVLGVLTHSHQIVLDKLGAPDADMAVALTRLRLEVRTGRPSITGPDG
jgi:hypothetical protein